MANRAPGLKRPLPRALILSLRHNTQNHSQKDDSHRDSDRVYTGSPRYSRTRGGTIQPVQPHTPGQTSPTSTKLLGTPRYAVFWISSLLSNIGTWMQSVAALARPEPRRFRRSRRPRRLRHERAPLDPRSFRIFPRLVHNVAGIPGSRSLVQSAGVPYLFAHYPGGNRRK